MSDRLTDATTVRETLDLAALLRPLNDQRPWTKVALQRVTGLSETRVSVLMRKLLNEGEVTKATERCECCGHDVVRYRICGGTA